MADDFTPATSAADEIRLRIDSLDRKIVVALKEAEQSEREAQQYWEDAKRMTRVRDEYQAMLDAAEGPHPLTDVLNARREAGE